MQHLKQKSTDEKQNKQKQIHRHIQQNGGYDFGRRSEDEEGQINSDGKTQDFG